MTDYYDDPIITSQETIIQEKMLMIISDKLEKKRLKN